MEKLKLFTSENGKFQMIIPIEWEYKNPSVYKTNKHAPVSFGKYDNMIGAFQVSCKEINSDISKIIRANELEIQSSDQKKLTFLEKLFVADKMHSYMWMCAIDDHFILITYTVNSRKHIFKSGVSEFEQVKVALKTIKFIKPEFREIVIALNRFDLFQSSTIATIDLRNRAIENGSFIEAIVLTANHIDALLRSSIILKDQIEHRNSTIDTSLLFQSETDKPIMERAIYKMALDRKIIGLSLFSELNQLYNERNKVVHRFIITDIRTEDILRISYRYHEVESIVWDLVSALEKKQYQEKIGIYGNGVEPGKELIDDFKLKMQFQLRDKHGNVTLPERRVKKS